MQSIAFPRRVEISISLVATVLPILAAMIWIADYWDFRGFPREFENLPYLHAFFTGAGFWAGIMINDLAKHDSSLRHWWRTKLAYCAINFRTQFDWNHGQAVMLVLKFKRKTMRATVYVERYSQNGWNGDKPYWSLASEETLIERRPFNRGSSIAIPLSVRGLDPVSPVQFGSHEIPMDHLPRRPHQKVVVTLVSEHGTIEESRIVNYHPYPLSFVTTPDQLDVIIQDSAPVER